MTFLNRTSKTPANDNKVFTKLFKKAAPAVNQSSDTPCDLPIDALSVVASKLSPLDRVRFKAVNTEFREGVRRLDRPSSQELDEAVAQLTHQLAANAVSDAPRSSLVKVPAGLLRITMTRLADDLELGVTNRGPLAPYFQFVQQSTLPEILDFDHGVKTYTKRPPETSARQQQLQLHRAQHQRIQALCGIDVTAIGLSASAMKRLEPVEERLATSLVQPIMRAEHFVPSDRIAWLALTLPDIRNGPYEAHFPLAANGQPLNGPHLSLGGRLNELGAHYLSPSLINRAHRERVSLPSFQNHVFWFSNLAEAIKCKKLLQHEVGDTEIWFSKPLFVCPLRPHAKTMLQKWHHYRDKGEVRSSCGLIAPLFVE